MQRITISIDEDLAMSLDGYVERIGYRSRSEGVRDIVRDGLSRDANERTDHSHSVANLSYIYNHRVRSLASRLANLQHAHHDLIASTTLVHLDHDYTLESIMLKGPTPAVRTLADLIRAERGVRSAQLNLVGVTPGDGHVHSHDHHHTGHAHLSPAVA